MLLGEARDEDRVDRSRQRFKAMLASAEEAADNASREHSAGVQLSHSMVSAIKFMNRAGGYLEAVSIVLPELGAELIDEFEAFAAKIDGLNVAHRDGERRIAEARRATAAPGTAASAMTGATIRSRWRWIAARMPNGEPTMIAGRVRCERWPTAA